MSVAQPQSTDYLNSPDHALLHRIIAADANASVQSLIVDANDNVGIGTTTFGTNAVKVLGMVNGTAPTSAITNGIQVFSVDSSDAKATLGLYLEQAIEDIGTFAASHKIKIKINGSEFWLQLDAV